MLYFYCLDVARELTCPDSVPPWYRLAHTLSIRQLQFVNPIVVLLVVCPIGPLPGVPGHHARDSPITLRYVTGG